MTLVAQGLTELADGPTGCGAVARSVDLLWNFSVTRLILLTEVNRSTRPNMTLSLQ